MVNFIAFLISFILFFTPVHAFEEQDLQSGEISRPASRKIEHPAKSEAPPEANDETDYYYYDDGDDSPAPVRAQKHSSSSRSFSSSVSNPLRFRGSLGISSSFFTGSIFVIYAFNRFIETDFGGFYHSDQGTHYKIVQYGPEADLVLKIANPTIFIPFISGGMGYIGWKRSYEDEIFDQSGSMIASHSYGLDLNLTKYFSIRVLRKTTVYLNTPPIALSDRKGLEGKKFSQNYVQFQVQF